MMTFAPWCVLCGGPVRVIPGNGWGPDQAKCIGWCGSKQEDIENMSDVRRQREFERVKRRIAIAEAEDIDVKGDVL